MSKLHLSISLLLFSLSLWMPSSALAVNYISTCNDLINIKQNVNDQYELAQDIECRGYGFTPIGTVDHPFTGTLNGNHHTIHHLTISSKNNDYVGLFGVTKGATISHMKLYDPVIFGGSFVGGLIGMGKNTTINDVEIIRYDTAESAIQGNSGKDASGNPRESLGSLAGALSDSTVTDCSSDVNALSMMTSDKTADPTYNYVGGLVGKIENTSVTGSSMYATVRGSFSVGGLLGKMVNSTVKNCYTSHTVVTEPSNTGIFTPLHNFGGLIGEMDNTTGGKSIVSNSMAQSTVGHPWSSTFNSGGLIGYIYSTNKNCSDANYSILVENSYETGSVSAQKFVGGLVGLITGVAVLQNNYSIGEVVSTIWPPNGGYGSLVGYITNWPDACIYSSYWNMDKEGYKITSGYGEAKTSQQMYEKSAYVNWDFDTVWNIKMSYPCLRGNKGSYC